MLYLECNSIIILHRASALIVHVGGGREGKIGNQLHRLFYNVHGISSLSFWRDSSSRIARVFSVAQWPNGRQVSCRGLQVIQRIKKREMFTHQGLLFKMWILAILQHPQMHHQFKRQRQRRLTDLEKKTGAWRNNWNKLWVCSLTGIPNMMMMMSKMPMGGIKIGAKIMTEKVDQTVTGLAQSRDLFESDDEDNLKRSQYCVCNNIVCDCDENPDSKSLLDNCWVEN